MDALLTLSPPSDAALRDLYDWLMEEPGLGGRVRFIGRPPGPGELGVALDAVAVAGASLASITAALAAALKSYFEHRPKTARIVIQLEDKNDVTRKVEITGANAADVGELVRVLRQSLSNKPGVE